MEGAPGNGRGFQSHEKRVDEMTHTKRLGRDRARTVRRQLKAILENSPRHLIKAETAAIGESFELYMIPGDAIPQAVANGSIYSVVERTGSWHHQVDVNGEPLGMAQSAAPGAIQNRWSLQSFFLSPYASKIAKATEKIDAERPDDETEALFITIPAYQLDIFLLRGTEIDEVYLVSCEEEERNGFIEGKFYSEEEFLVKLAAMPIIDGLSDER
jgi:hypothetical protein